MVGLMLDLVGGGEAGAGDPAPAASKIRFHHVDARLSRTLGDVGGLRLGKLPRLLGYCAQAVWLRWRRGARVLYYVPAPPARTPVLRDWLVMAICRPFFPRLVFHWHAGGLSEWVRAKAGRVPAAVTRWLLARPDLSLVLRPYHRRDAEYFRSRRVVVLPNGIPDPCPDFDATLRAERERRVQERQRRLSSAGAGNTPAVGGLGDGVFRVLYLSLCRREKGLFDALDAVALANRTLGTTSLRVELTVAGDFGSEEDRRSFEQRMQAPDLAGRPARVRQVGFVQGKAKDALLRESDCLCLPTYLPEGLPVVLIEAMAYGLAPITTTWCDLHEVLPPGYPGAVPARSPEQLAAKLVEFAGRPYDPGLRGHFLAQYTAARFARALESVLSSLAAQPEAPAARRAW